MKHLILSLAMLMGIAASGQQNMTIDVAKQYAVTYADASKTIAQKYAAGSDTIALKYAWARAKYERMPYAQFRAMFLGWGIAKDVAFFNEAPNVLASGNQNTFVFADWTNAKGKWLVNGTVQIPRAGMRGASSFGYHGNGGDHGQHATEFVMVDGNWWPKEGTERRLFETAYANEHGSLAYNESFTIENVRLSGPMVKDGITRIGMLISRGGECSYINQVRADGFSIGIGGRGGVPLTMGTISTFQNSTAGFATLGGALSTYNIGTLSGDANKYLLGLLPYNGEASGGRINVGLIKYEDGTTAGMPHGNGAAVYAEGQFAVNVGMLSFANQGGATPIAAFVVDHRLPNNAYQNSYIRANVIGQGYGRLLQNNANGSAWRSPGEYSAVGFEYYPNRDLFVSAIPVVKEGTTTNPPPGPMDPPPGPVDPPPGPVDPPPPTAKPYTVTTNVPQWSAAENVKYAVDGNMATRWTSGRYPTTNDWITIDMGANARWKTITIDATGSAGDFMSGLQVSVSANGTSWSKLTTSTAANATVNAVYGPVTKLTSSTWRTNRYIRIQPTAVGNKWWSIHEITVE